MQIRVSVKIKETMGIKIKFIKTAIIETLLNAYKQIGKEKICADTTVPVAKASYGFKNFNLFASGFAKTIIPITTIKESWKPTQSSWTGEKIKIKIPANESAVKLSYLLPLSPAKSITEVIINALIEDAEKPHIPQCKIW